MWVWPRSGLVSTDNAGVEMPTAYASRLLSSAERHYASTKGNLPGVVWAFHHFRCYLLGKRFLVRTDHRALEHLDRFKELSAIIACWLEFLSQFEYDLQYRQEGAHANADALSRLPTLLGILEVSTSLHKRWRVSSDTMHYSMQVVHYSY